MALTHKLIESRWEDFVELFRSSPSREPIPAGGSAAIPQYSRKSETMCEAGPGHGRPGQAMGGRARPWEASEAAANNASDPSEPNTFHVHFLHQHLSHTQFRTSYCTEPPPPSVRNAMEARAAELLAAVVSDDTADPEALALATGVEPRSFAEGARSLR